MTRRCRHCALIGKVAASSKLGQAHSTGSVELEDHDTLRRRISHFHLSDEPEFKARR